MTTDRAVEGETIEWTALDPYERYRRVTWEGMLIIQRTDEHVWKNQGPEAWQRFSDETRPGWAGPIGRKLVKDHPEELAPTIPGALKLMATYGAEVWGGGHRGVTHLRVLSETEGNLVITDHGCPQWRAFSEEMRGVFPCHKACGKEMDSVVKQGLGPEFEVVTTEGRPLGNDDCVWHVRKNAPAANP